MSLDLAEELGILVREVQVQAQRELAGDVPLSTWWRLAYHELNPEAQAICMRTGLAVVLWTMEYLGQEVTPELAALLSSLRGARGRAKSKTRG